MSSTPAPSASPTSSPISTPPPGLGATPTPIQLAQGGVLGIDTVGEGNTATGGQGQTVDGLTCNNLVTPYHVHAHVSLLVDGQRFAVPDVLGFFKPGAEVNGYTANAQCFYFLHTHDADGYIHIEGLAPTAFTLGELFDIWGEPLSSTAVAIFSGQVVAYTATAAQGFNQTTGPFTQYQGDVRALQLVSHEEIVLEIGPVLITPPNLPAVIFYTSK
ncbi:MAG: hypothetical protein GIW99_06320 [Candidatus Eremiobacteraeota bacterium]|nr:hypothetical protein [Candidatus Eremiobacteraeota bacterium]